MGIHLPETKNDEDLGAKELRIEFPQPNGSKWLLHPFFEEQNGDVKNGEDVTGQCGRDDRVHQVARLSSKGVSQRVTKCQLFKACFVAVLDD